MWSKLHYCLSAKVVRVVNVSTQVEQEVMPYLTTYFEYKILPSM